MTGEREYIQQAFGKVLRDIRLSKNITQAKLAELGEFERAYISALERGIKHPSLHTVFRLADALEIHPSKLTDEVYDLLT